MKNIYSRCFILTAKWLYFGGAFSDIFNVIKYGCPLNWHTDVIMILRKEGYK